MICDKFYKLPVSVASRTDLNGTDNQGRTALMFGSGDGHVAVVALLLANGAPVDATDGQVAVNYIPSEPTSKDDGGKGGS